MGLNACKLIKHSFHITTTVKMYSGYYSQLKMNFNQYIKKDVLEEIIRPLYIIARNLIILENPTLYLFINIFCFFFDLHLKYT